MSGSVADSPTDPADLGSSGYLHLLTEEYSNAQILAMPTAPQLVVPQPGSDLLLLPHYVVVQIHQQVGYGNLKPATLLMQWVEAYTATTELVNMPTNGTGDKFAILLPSNPGADLDEIVNRGLEVYVSNDGEDLSLGHANNFMRVTVAHFVLNTLTGLLVPVS